MGRPGEKRRYTKTDKAYLKKTVKQRAERNKDRAALERKSGKALPAKAKGASKKGDVEAAHKGRGAKGPVKRQSVKANRGWRKGKKGDGGRAATRKRTKK